MSDRNHEQAAIDRRRKINRAALMEKSPFSVDEGEEIGRDPRSLSADDLQSAGIERQTLMKAVRRHCIDCCVYQSSEVRKCVAVACDLWPFRMGANPWRKGEKVNRGQPPPDKIDSMVLNGELRTVLNTTPDN